MGHIDLSSRRESGVLAFQQVPMRRHTLTGHLDTRKMPYRTCTNFSMREEVKLCSSWALNDKERGFNPFMEIRPKNAQPSKNVMALEKTFLGYEKQQKPKVAQLPKAN